jgi:hypothetical protein
MTGSLMALFGHQGYRALAAKRQQARCVNWRKRGSRTRQGQTARRVRGGGRRAAARLSLRWDYPSATCFSCFAAWAASACRAIARGSTSANMRACTQARGRNHAPAAIRPFVSSDSSPVSAPASFGRLATSKPGVSRRRRGEELVRDALRSVVTGVKDRE